MPRVLKRKLLIVFCCFEEEVQLNGVCVEKRDMLAPVTFSFDLKKTSDNVSLFQPSHKAFVERLSTRPLVKLLELEVGVCVFELIIRWLDGW